MPWKECNVMDQREEFVRRSYERGEAFVDLCREYGISSKTGYKWCKRFEEDGKKGLMDRSRRPMSHSEQLNEEVVCEMIRIKQAHPHWGPRKIREIYRRGRGQAPSESSFKRVLGRAGLVERRRKRPSRCGDGMRAEVVATKPNDLWTVDFKGWWHISGRQRCEPLTVCDAFSRYLLEIKAMKTSRTDAVRRVFEELFSEYGMPGMIRSDNGSPFACMQAPLRLSPLSVWWIQLGIGLDRIDPGCPGQNGTHERMHLDVRRELQGMIEGDLQDHQAAFDVWRTEYNWERPHESLGMRMPGEVYKKSQRAYYRNGVDIEYPADMVVRLVSKEGFVSIDARLVFLSASLRGVQVGMRSLPGGRYEVWLDYLRLGEIELEVASMNWAVPPSSSTTNKDKVLPMF